jgi:hypothetical protein
MVYLKGAAMWMAALLGVATSGRAEYAGTSKTPADLVTGSRLPLSTKGRDIVDAQGNKVKLACVNWYGAHMELFAPNGLHKNSYKNITEHIVALGFNCIRYPISVELVVRNPVVPDAAVTANPDLKGLRALEVMDKLMDEFQANDLLVILNIHTQAASWCCTTDDINGLWNTPEFPTDSFLDSIAISTRRYANYSNVVGYDVKNELHDYDGTILDWGKTGNKDTDWKVASELAGKAVLENDPDMLVIVGGLCFNGVLSPMQANPPKMIKDNKLVFTTHSYGFSTWWTIVSDMLGPSWQMFEVIAIAMLVMSLVGLGAIAVLPKPRASLQALGRRALLLSLFSWGIALSAGFVLCGMLWIAALDGAGCRVMDEPAMLTIYISSTCVLMCVVGLAFTKLYVHETEGTGASDGKPLDNSAVVPFDLDSAAQSESTGGCLPGCKVFNLLIFLLLTLIFMPLLLFFAQEAQRDLVSWDLEIKWGIKDSKVPIWVGEFGMARRDLNDFGTNNWWDNFIDLLEREDFGFAYWALDGERWYNETQEWGDEGFGILQRDYVNIRSPENLADVQAVMPIMNP